MTPDEAAWIRDHAWTPAMRRQPYWIPGTSTATYDHAHALALCACMVHVCSACRGHRHELCHAQRIRPQPEWYLQAPGTHRAIPVWAAGRACRSLCPCPHVKPPRWETVELPGLELAEAR
jgi:hypothetical protein